jgi:hypothetical protein
MGILSGTITASLGGAAAGSLGWPMKLMDKFQFEQIWFVGMLFGLVMVPWTITFLFCPNAFSALNSVDFSVFIKANIFSLAWGIGNVLMGISLVRIGSSLSFAILSGVGIPLGVIIPMLFKGSGVFEQSPDLYSPTGMVILVATVLMIVGVVFVTLAGFGRDKVLKTKNKMAGGFLGGLIMCLISGICSVGPAFAFVYSQAPIRSAMIEQGAGEWPASIAVWASSMLLGVIVNIVYPAYLMTKKRTWHALREKPKEIGLSLIVGLNLFLAFALWGLGMLLLGPLGASLGFGLYFSFQIIAAQCLGWISGEWKGVKGKPIYMMVIAIAILLVASGIMAKAAYL